MSLAQGKYSVGQTKAAINKQLSNLGFKQKFIIVVNDNNPTCSLDTGDVEVSISIPAKEISLINSSMGFTSDKHISASYIMEKKCIK